jgi:hypothetical protein
VSEDARSATVIASASTTTAETVISPVNAGNYSIVKEQVFLCVVKAFQFLYVDLNQDAKDFNDLNH